MYEALTQNDSHQSQTLSHLVEEKHIIITSIVSDTAVVRGHELLPLPLIQAVIIISHMLPLVVKGHDLVCTLEWDTLSLSLLCTLDIILHGSKRPPS